MPTLLILMRTDSFASLRMAATGIEGAAGQVAAIASLGGSVTGQWALLGDYDLAIVASFPSEDVAAAYCLSANAAGFQTSVHLALHPEQLALAQALVMASESDVELDASLPVEPEHATSSPRMGDDDV
jgi:uncharacterized protein with GYD domain